jgi:hypothetical protein
MKAKIKISSNYGFDHNWTLEVSVRNETKSFLLGQDVKFCSRVLQMEPRDVVEAIGTGEINEGTVGNTKLANFIIKELGLTEKKLESLQPWELCCQ